MKASVIIPVWNGREYLPACLDALLAQDYPDFEVIVVDNASVDGSADLVAERYPQVRLIRNAQNLGFAGGCNVGLNAAQGDVLVLLNQDTVVRPGWLQALVRALMKPEVGVAGCKILYPDGETIQHAGGWIEWPWGSAYHHGKGEKDEGQWNNPREVEYVTGAAMAFRRDVMERVGPLDEEFWPGYFEDTDFCFRVREAGYSIWYIPESTVVHIETTSIAQPWDISLFYERGRLRFVLKHLPPKRFLNEFIPAETERFLPFTRDTGGDPLRLAYLEAIPMAARVLPQRWNADGPTVEAVIRALQSLCRAPFSRTLVGSQEEGKREFPALHEFEFRSSVPLLGPLITRFREACYNVATRWAIRYLIQQQTAINKELCARIDTLECRLHTLECHLYALERRLTESHSFMALEVSRLIRELEILGRSDYD